MSLLTPQRPSEGAHTHSGATMVPDASRAERTASFEVADFPVPHGREEEWRFTPVDRLGAFFRDEPTGACLQWEESLPEGVTLSTLSVPQWRDLGVPAPQDRAAAAAAAHSGGVALVDVPAEAELAEPVRIRLTGTEQDLVHGHLTVRVGRFARATVVIEHAGVADYSEVLTVLAGDGSHVTLVTVQEWDDASHHLGQHDVVVGRDATVRHIAVTLGGGVVRLNTNTSYTGPGGSFEGLGVYFADAGQHLEHRLFVDHEAPHCRSNVEYKGALQGETARTVWVGDVLIRASAEGTDTYELNRNLILSDGARADSVPNLEIETGEIEGAGHASATGRFDDEQLFYLQARGIPEDEARRLVVRGFFAGVVARIGVPEVQEHLMAVIERELAGGGE
ncbi:Fe-S cluster assembly protein SufD [Phycicoccus endophyticus]|uniref:Fe-S cluster assembly protein SufD n=1 Tax=Phycicoccus endophyticus TaxID=1690220 RepID=A0A7G9R4E5_9MICO|nr:Fe-S cluster assembly protein SufD [Phycicoccus endophyticus]NHI18347.1 Fe-S cluster assembly protein SufD [Phycicoccus endophyticus]QNN50470.1 Fe-S cluster assembly protein SufD [Phycicoccus endophyticus]GGL24529.1 Fe-S cluster assembly protein SufD [Phycicoccus endophyticus]